MSEKVQSKYDVLDIIFEAITDPIACLGCACETCDPAPHNSTCLSQSDGVIYIDVDEKTYEIRVIESLNSSK